MLERSEEAIFARLLRLAYTLTAINARAFRVCNEGSLGWRAVAGSVRADCVTRISCIGECREVVCFFRLLVGVVCSHRWLCCSMLLFSSARSAVEIQASPRSG